MKLEQRLDRWPDRLGRHRELRQALRPSVRVATPSRRLVLKLCPHRCGRTGLADRLGDRYAVAIFELGRVMVGQHPARDLDEMPTRQVADVSQAGGAATRPSEDAGFVAVEHGAPRFALMMPRRPELLAGGSVPRRGVFRSLTCFYSSRSAARASSPKGFRPAMSSPIQAFRIAILSRRASGFIFLRLST